MATVEDESESVEAETSTPEVNFARTATAGRRDVVDGAADWNAVLICSSGQLSSPSVSERFQVTTGSFAYQQVDHKCVQLLRDMDWSSISHDLATHQILFDCTSSSTL